VHVNPLFNEHIGGYAVALPEITVRCRSVVKWPAFNPPIVMETDRCLEKINEEQTDFRIFNDVSKTREDAILPKFWVCQGVIVLNDGKARLAEAR
jgi:hypothetical protein